MAYKHRAHLQLPSFTLNKCKQGKPMALIRSMVSHVITGLETMLNRVVIRLIRIDAKFPPTPKIEKSP